MAKTLAEMIVDAIEREDVAYQQLASGMKRELECGTDVPFLVRMAESASRHWYARTVLMELRGTYTEQGRADLERARSECLLCHKPKPKGRDDSFCSAECKAKMWDVMERKHKEASSVRASQWADEFAEASRGGRPPDPREFSEAVGGACATCRGVRPEGRKDGFCSDECKAVWPARPATQPKSRRIPKLGDRVHYMSPDADKCPDRLHEWPATAMMDKTEAVIEGGCYLPITFTWLTPDLDARVGGDSVPYSPTGEPGTWHWPEDEHG